MLQIPTLDLAALILFACAWAGYTTYTDHGTARARTLSAVMGEHRLRWMLQMVARENRVADSTLLGNLMRSVSFFASTSILILGGLLALFGSIDRSYALMAELPFVSAGSKGLFEAKVILLVTIFVYTFFKFTWSIRQFNYCCVAIAAAPPATAPEEQREAFARHAARVNALGARSFNEGLRGYYFALATLVWFVHPVGYIAATLMVVAILYRREFHSKTLKALRAALSDQQPG